MECPADRDALRTLLAGVAASEEKKQLGCCVDTSEITDFSALFDGTRSTGVDAFGADDALCWDTSAVTTMFYTFYHIGTYAGGAFTGATGAKSFNAELAWDTSKVTTMGMTFWEATAFNRQLVWDTSSVTSMEHTFSSAWKFNRPLVWDTSKVTMMPGAPRRLGGGAAARQGAPNRDAESLRYCAAIEHAEDLNDGAAGLGDLDEGDDDRLTACFDFGI